MSDDILEQMAKCAQERHALRAEVERLREQALEWGNVVTALAGDLGKDETPDDAVVRIRHDNKRLREALRRMLDVEPVAHREELCSIVPCHECFARAALALDPPSGEP